MRELMHYKSLRATSTDQKAIDSLNFPESYGLGQTPPHKIRSRTKIFKSLCGKHIIKILQSLCGKHIIKILRDSDGFFSASSYLITNEMPLRMVAHNTYGPASINLNIEGNIKWIKYYKKDKLHRFNGPAIIAYNDNGLIVGESYYLNGNRHNPIGPAKRTFSDIWYNEFYVVNCRLTLDSFCKRKRWQYESLRDE